MGEKVAIVTPALARGVTFTRVKVSLVQISGLLLFSVYGMCTEILFNANGDQNDWPNILYCCPVYFLAHCNPFSTGAKNCTMNLHLLGHLAECVRDWGPLWAYSCFSFESSNNHLRKLFHGSKDMSKQVCGCVSEVSR